MKISKSIFTLSVLFFILLIQCHPGTLVEVTGRWLQYSQSQEIIMNVMGRTDDGIEDTRTRTLPAEEFFLNGHIYTHFLFDTYEWYACQVIQKKGENYHVIGFAVFDIFQDDGNISIDLTPSFLFDWGYNMNDQQIYMDIDYGKCPEIDKDQVKPFSMKLAREKYTFDKLHGKGPKSGNQFENRTLDFEKFRKMQELVQEKQ